MKNLNIKGCAAKNFLCYGPKGISFDFTKMGNIVLIRGVNLDIDPNNEEERKSSNGTGKTSTQNIIVYTLFGKTISPKLKHDDVINNQSKKKLETEVLIDDFRIVRTRKPDSLRIWESKEGIWDKDSELSLGGMPATQKWLEDKLGLTYDTFVNLFVFTDNNAGSFLECKPDKKRELVENLLSLDVYRQYHENAKTLRNKAKEIIKDKGKNYEFSLIEVENCKKRIKAIEEQEAQWKKNKEKELLLLAQQYSEKQKQLSNSNIGEALLKYNSAQDEINSLNIELPLKEGKAAEVEATLPPVVAEYNELNIKKTELENKINALQVGSAIADKNIQNNNKIMKDVELQKCNQCGYLDEIVLKNAQAAIKQDQELVKSNNSLLSIHNEELLVIKTQITKTTTTIKEIDGAIKKLSSEIDLIRKKIITLSRIERPEATSIEKVLEEQINSLKNQILEKKSEVEQAPFKTIQENAAIELEIKQQESENKRLELDKANEELPYYEFWVKAFGDDGIRKFIIDSIIPALNSRIEYWLQFLIDGKISLVFDNALEETINRNPADGDSFVYYAMSGGERRRLNLAVSQAFSYIMMLNTGTCPSLVFLDEVTSNIDPIGVQGVYNMIMELSKERQVFVTTHDQDLLEMLSGCSVINLVKEKGFTTLK